MTEVTVLKTNKLYSRNTSQKQATHGHLHSMCPDEVGDLSLSHTHTDRHTQVYSNRQTDSTRIEINK